MSFCERIPYERDDKFSVFHHGIFRLRRSWKGDRKSVSKTGKNLCKTYLIHNGMIFFYRGSLFFSFSSSFINRFEIFTRRVEIYWSLESIERISSFEFEKDILVEKKKKIRWQKLRRLWSGARRGKRREEKKRREERYLVPSIDNSTLSILYPTFAFLLKLVRLQR